MKLVGKTPIIQKDKRRVKKMKEMETFSFGTMCQ
jgi:hypothetical protein